MENNKWHKEFKGVREAFAAALTDLVAEVVDAYGVFPDSLMQCVQLLSAKNIPLITSNAALPNSARLTLWQAW